MYAEKEEALKEDSTAVKPLVNTNGRFNFMDPTEPYYYEAIGRRLAVQEENIGEGDVLIVDPTLPAKEGDLILRSSPEGPEFVIYQPEEKKYKRSRFSSHSLIPGNLQERTIAITFYYIET